MSTAGYNTTIKKSGTSTALTNEAMANTSGFTYQITDTSRRVLDRTIVPTFKDNGSPVASSDIASIDYLFGTVTFLTSKTEPVVMATGSYVPLADILGAYSHSLSLSRTLLDDSSYDKTSVNGGIRTYITGLADGQLTVSRWENLDNTYYNALQNRTPLLIEVHAGGSGDKFRGWFVCESEVHSGAVADQEQQELTFQLDSRYEVNLGFGT